MESGVRSMELKETLLSGETVFSGRLLDVRRDRIRLANGSESIREVVRHPGGVTVLPVFDDGTVLLVRQFRYPIGEALLEAPAGKLEPGEEPEAAALRELSEETGLIPGSLTPMGAILPSPGFCDEKLSLFLARDLRQADAHPDEDELLELVRMPLSELLDQIMDGSQYDAKTVAAALKAARLMGL